MSTLPFTSAQIESRPSINSLLPACFFIFYLSTFVCIPLFADKVGAPVPVDKIAVFLLLPWALLGAVRAIRAQISTLLFALGYFAFASISSLSHMSEQTYGTYPSAAPLIGLLLDAKPFLFMFGIYELLARRSCNSQRTVKVVLRVLVAIAFMNGAFVLRDIIVGGQSIWGIPLGAGPFGLPLADGLFNHKYPSACTTMLGALAALSMMRERFTLPRIGFFVFLFVLLIFNGAAKELIALLCAGILHVLLSSRKSTLINFQGKLLVILVMCGVGLSAGPYITQMVGKRIHDYGAEASVRVQMHAASYAIAKVGFPLGSGAGTFGSMPSRDMAYSPLYFRYGIFAMWQGGPDKAGFLLDAWWPHILAESGFIGCAFYIAFLLGIIRRLKIAHARRRDASWFFLLNVSIALLINSIAAPTYTMDVLSPVVGLTWGAALLAADVPGKETSEPVDHAQTLLRSASS